MIPLPPTIRHRLDSSRETPVRPRNHETHTSQDIYRVVQRRGRSGRGKDRAFKAPTEIKKKKKEKKKNGREEKEREKKRRQEDEEEAASGRRKRSEHLGVPRGGVPVAVLDFRGQRPLNGCIKNSNEERDQGRV